MSQSRQSNNYSPARDQNTGSHRILSLNNLVERGIISPLVYATTLSALRLSGENDERVGLALALAQMALKLGHLGLRLSAIAEDFSPEVLKELKERELAELDDDQLTIKLNQLEEESELIEDWSGLPPLDEWLICLKNSPAVWCTTSPRTASPFVLDDTILFTLKAWRGEVRVAHALARMTRVDVGLIPQPKQLWTRLFANDEESWFDGGAKWDRSKLALYLALRSSVMVIHGGPGTGKTTLTQRILATLIEQYSTTDQEVRIAITAPTGKAAQRLTESIQARASFFHLPDPIQQQLGRLQGMTLHSLLGIAPGKKPEYHTGHPLPFDVIVVDECSMVDLWLLQSLLDAIKLDPQRQHVQRLLLIGDPQQLPSVSAGSPFTELCGQRGKQISRSQLKDIQLFLRGKYREYDLPPQSSDPEEHDVELSHQLQLDIIDLSSEKEMSFIDRVSALNQVRRVSSESGVHAAATAIQKVEKLGVEAVTDCFKDPKYTDTAWLPAPPFPTALFEEVVRHAQRTISLVKINPQEALQHLKGLCLLSPHYAGSLGVNELNEAVEVALRNKRLGGWGRGYVGRPILITQNHPPTGLVNGDIGIIGEEHQVFFEGRERPVKLELLPPHRTVFAMSIHKSQGSEFKKVVMCIPPNRSPIMTRELIYTGLTRAKEYAVVVGNLSILGESILAQVERGGQLSVRLERLLSKGGL